MDKEYHNNITNFSELEKALNEWFNVFNWDIDISSYNISTIASISKFKYVVKWFFYCFNNKLTSLKWCPVSVWWDFNCHNNQLTLLEWCPNTVKWSFNCSFNQLITLDWCPTFIWWDLLCSANKLTSLEWSPIEINWDYYCHSNQLTTLEWCPRFVKWRFNCANNNLIPIEKKKWNIFKLWNNIYIRIVKPNIDDIQNLISFDISTDKWSHQYYNSFINFSNSVIKLDQKNITDTDIILHWKKFKKKFINL